MRTDYNVFMEAGMLACPNCGAAAASDAVSCGYCHAQLATVACAACFGMSFAGASHCAHCGASLSSLAAAPAGERRCPRCSNLLGVMAIGAAILEECGGCGGLWVDVKSFERLIADRSTSSAYVGMGSASIAPSHEAHETTTLRYVPCPDCKKLMQRVNFARCSGVIVDVCKGHGTWFDRDELRQILEFVRAGGLDAARAKEKDQLDHERQRLKEQALSLRATATPLDSDDHHSAVHAAGDLLKWLLG
jgi:Zn-finger nucleic acid-binding protein